jgi:hypothetical protein
METKESILLWIRAQVRADTPQDEVEAFMAGLEKLELAELKEFQKKVLWASIELIVVE